MNKPFTKQDLREWNGIRVRVSPDFFKQRAI